jgi:hypothetical protein
MSSDAINSRLRIDIATLPSHGEIPIDAFYSPADPSYPSVQFIGEEHHRAPDFLIDTFGSESRGGAMSCHVMRVICGRDDFFGGIECAYISSG